MAEFLVKMMVYDETLIFSDSGNDWRPPVWPGGRRRAKRKENKNIFFYTFVFFCVSFVVCFFVFVGGDEGGEKEGEGGGRGS